MDPDHVASWFLNARSIVDMHLNHVELDWFFQHSWICSEPRKPLS
jgi:hypothetical protein